MRNRFVKDVAIVTVGNIIFMIANILVGFLLPLLISVEDYGYYKIYTLYLSYSGLLHFGFIDGVFLEYSGFSYDELDHKQFRTFSFFMIMLESVLAVVIILFSLIFLKGEYLIIGIFIALGLIAINIGQYYQYVAQAVSRFSQFSKRKIYNSIGIIASLLFLWIYNKLNADKQATYLMYVSMSLIVSFALTLWFVLTYRDITFGEKNSLIKEKSNIFNLLKKGFILTVAYEASRIVLLIDRQFVSILFPLDTYAKYAFAYNILSCVTSVIIGIATVLFPKLKRMSVDESVSFFPSYMGLLSAIVCFFLAGYYPVVWIINGILPKYSESLVYFKIVFPVLALSSCITIIIFTYYKIYDKIQIFLYVCLGALGISIITNFIAYYLFKSAEAISIASVITTIIWYLLSILYLSKKYDVFWINNFIYSLIMIVIFYGIVFIIKNSIASMIIYIVLFGIVTYIMQKKSICHFIKSTKNE